jgi:anti-sigma regulatory factor (Ser/Thr protein kinase)
MLAAQTVTTDDHIRLALPADAEYGRIARIAAAGLALRMGFSYREIEDLRLAVDEAIILLLRHDRGDGTLTIEFGPSPDQLVIEVRAAPSDTNQPDDEARERFATIVGDVLDEYEVDEPRRRIRMVKAHVPAS